MSTQRTIGGRHVIVDLTGAWTERLRDARGLMRCLESALHYAEFHVLRTVLHTFEGGGGGFTGVILLSESHAAVHTYPEAGYLALDVFSCGPADPRKVVQAVAEFVQATEVRSREISRSPGSPEKGSPLPQVGEA